MLFGRELLTLFSGKGVGTGLDDVDDLSWSAGTGGDVCCKHGASMEEEQLSMICSCGCFDCRLLVAHILALILLMNTMSCFGVVLPNPPSPLEVLGSLFVNVRHGQAAISKIS